MIVIFNRRQTKWLIGAFLLVPMMAGQRMAQESPRTVVGILIDNTGSMRSQLGLEKEIAKEIITASKATIYFSLFGFQFAWLEKKERAVVLAGSQCSTDRENLKKEIDILPTQPGQTMLYDTIRDAADFLDAKRPTKCDVFVEKTLVVISDGEDRVSGLKDKELFSLLKAQNVKVYAVGLIDDLPDESFLSKSQREKSKDFLKKLTTETGGNVVFPKKKQSSVEIVKALFESKSASKK